MKKERRERNSEAEGKRLSLYPSMPLAKCTASILVLSVDKVEGCTDAEKANQLEPTPSSILQPGSFCLTFQVGYVSV
jgi:hypothetical protein